MEHEHICLTKLLLPKFVEIKGVNLSESGVIFIVDHFLEIHEHVHRHCGSDEYGEETSEARLVRVTFFVEIQVNRVPKHVV
tara:strand:- start:172 stop:414 length:243 start_codon:yes stop_codon:yes gene_type:complete